MVETECWADPSLGVATALGLGNATDVVLSNNRALLAVRRPTGTWEVGPLTGPLLRTPLRGATVEFCPNDGCLLERSTELRVVDVATGNLVHETSGGRVQFAFAQRGASLYFLDKFDPALGSGVLRHLDVARGHVTTIDDASELVLSPSSRTLAYRLNADASELKLVDLVTKTVSAVASLVPAGGYQFSPLDESLAYVSNWSSTMMSSGTLELRSANGTTITLGIVEALAPTLFEFSPDGSHLAFGRRSGSAISGQWADTSTGTVIALGDDPNPLLAASLGNATRVMYRDAVSNGVGRLVMSTPGAAPTLIAPAASWVRATPDQSALLFSSGLDVSVFDPARGTTQPVATGSLAHATFSPASSSALLSFGTGQLDLLRLPSGQARTLSLDASEPRYLPDARHVLFAEKQTDLIFDRTEVPARQVIATGATIDSLMANRANDTVAFRLRGSNDVLMALRVKDGAHVVVDDFDGAALWLDASTLLYVKGQEIYTRSITWR